MNKYLIRFLGNQTTAAEGMEAGLAEMDGKEAGCDKRKGGCSLCWFLCFHFSEGRDSGTCGLLEELCFLVFRGLYLCLETLKMDKI